MTPSDYDLVVVDLPGPKGTPGPQIKTLHCRRAIITLMREARRRRPKGTRLEGWDQVTVLTHAAAEEEVQRASSMASRGRRHGIELDR